MNDEFQMGDIIKGYASAFGVVTGRVIGPLEVGDYYVRIIKPKKYRNTVVWVQAYGQSAIPSAKLVSKEQQA